MHNPAPVLENNTHKLLWDHPNYYIIENGQNTKKSPGDLRRLAVTQTPVKDHVIYHVQKYTTKI